MLYQNVPPISLRYWIVISIASVFGATWAISCRTYCTWATSANCRSSPACSPCCCWQNGGG